jgi:cyclophilin family peptidyl-prolyl cis-trans isomerase
MVRIGQKSTTKQKVSAVQALHCIVVLLFLLVTGTVWLSLEAMQVPPTSASDLGVNYIETVTYTASATRSVASPTDTVHQTHASDESLLIATESNCPYRSWQDLTEREKDPTAMAHRHMVDPPKGGRRTLVCCQTSAGPWNIAIHHNWAPLGAQRFVDMVQADYFNNQNVPLMRCVRNFLCQFGLAGLASRQFQSTIADDPNWLPEGPTHRENDAGVKRFSVGYFAFAGARKSSGGSRTNQIIVALKDNGPLAGGSPWEVPWGELVGGHSFQTLSKVYTGYGEKGPSQALLHKENALEQVTTQFPKLDSIISCHVVDVVEES